MTLICTHCSEPIQPGDESNPGRGGRPTSHADHAVCFTHLRRRSEAAEERTREAVAASLASAMPLVHIGRLLSVDSTLPVEEFREAVVAEVTRLHNRPATQAAEAKTDTTLCSFCGGPLLDDHYDHGEHEFALECAEFLRGRATALATENESLRARVAELVKENDALSINISGTEAALDEFAILMFAKDWEEE